MQAAYFLVPFLSLFQKPKPTKEQRWLQTRCGIHQRVRGPILLQLQAGSSKPEVAEDEPEMGAWGQALVLHQGMAEPCCCLCTWGAALGVDFTS